MTSPNPPAAAPAAAAAWSPRMWGLLFVLAGNMLIDALEVSVMVVAMPAIGDDLRLPMTEVQWAMTGFALGFGGLMLLGGRIVELLGRRPVYLIALVAFAAASVVAGLAEDAALLMATRFVKGFAAALTAPTGLAIIGAVFAEGPDRNRAVSVYALFGSCGFTAGLLLSGALTEVSWRWAVAFPAPVVLLLFALGVRLIPGDGRVRRRTGTARRPPADALRRLDLLGAVTFTGALLSLAFAIVSVPSAGASGRGIRTAGCFVAAAALLAAFVRIERRAAHPLVRPSVLKAGALPRSALGAAALNGSYLGLLFIISFQLQSTPGRGPLWTGLALLPASAPLAVTALWSGRMVSRFGAPWLIALGGALPLTGYLLYLLRPDPVPYASGLLPTLLLVGAGFVLAFAALNTQATAGVPEAERGPAVATYQSAVQIGAVLMLTLVAATVTAHQQPTPDLRPAMALVSAAGLLGLVVGLAGAVARTGRHDSRTNGPRAGGTEPHGAPDLEPNTSVRPSSTGPDGSRS
ncbi:MFS transporter [Streptomyces abyssalis]|uniref:MFS transporter n=1 Tax=Streptomyces abyssalis TaxID=933944 RepID=UPI00099FCD3B|nr:MFS transporter [Streptomyces abyssalis]